MRIAMLIAVAGFLAGGSSVATAPGQVRPGEMTRAEVWVQNQPLAVDLRHANLDSPLRVVVVNGSTPLQVVVMPRTWEYRSIVVPPGADAATALGTLGTQGWEPTGIVLPTTNGAQLLLKRPR